MRALGPALVIFGSEGGTTATRASATGRAEASGTAPTVGVAILGLLALLEGIETIGEGEHAVASQRVVDGILDVVGSDVAVNVLLLSQDVIDREGERGLLVAQELIGDGAVPAPLLGVVAAAVTAGGAVVQVGADDESEGCRVGAVEHAAPGVDIAVVGRGDGVGRGLETVTGPHLDVKDTVAEGQTWHVVDHPGVAAVLDIVVDTLGDRVTGEHVAGEVPGLLAAEGEAEHVHRHGAPHAVHVGVAGDASTGDGVIFGG